MPSLSPLAIRLSLGLAGLLAAAPAGAFHLVAPAEGTVLKAGQPLDVRVDPGSEIGLRQVRYYWYRFGEEPLVAQQADPALVAGSASQPAFGGRLMVPDDVIGRMRLLAVGEVTRGRLAGKEEFDEVLLQVEPPSDLTGIEFEVEKPWRLDTIGKLLDVPVVGQFADGRSRRLNGLAAGNRYESSDEQVVQMTGTGLLRVVGKGKAWLKIRNRGKEGRLDIVVTAAAEPNGAPVARAGPDQTVKSGATVMLSALGSSDPDGDPLRYEWTQVRGHKVSLLDPNSPQATFVAPPVSSKRLLRFRLRVTDMQGPDTVKGADSLPSFIDIWVLP